MHFSARVRNRFNPFKIIANAVYFFCVFVAEWLYKSVENNQWCVEADLIHQNQGTKTLQDKRIELEDINAK